MCWCWKITIGHMPPLLFLASRRSSKVQKYDITLYQNSEGTFFLQDGKIFWKKNDPKLCDNACLYTI